MCFGPLTRIEYVDDGSSCPRGTEPFHIAMPLASDWSDVVTDIPVYSLLKTVCAPILVAGSAICLITVTITLCVLSFGSAILLKRTPWNLIMKSSVMSTVGPGV